MDTKALGFLLKYIRRIIYVVGIVIAFCVYLFILYVSPSAPWQSVDLINAYATLAFGFLYVTLLASPLYAAFPSFPYRAVYIKARRALGNIAFLFAFLHGLLVYIGMNGYVGYFLSPYSLQVSMGLGFVALLILAVLTLTSCDAAVRALGTRWKLLHRLVYLGGIAVLVHVLTIGVGFTNLYDPRVLFAYAVVAFLLVLEGIRVMKFFSRRVSAR